MSPTSGDLLLVNRGGVNYQIDYDDMSTLQDTDLLLVNRAGVNYQIAASDLDLGPDGLILPPVEVLTPVNGAGLNEGDAYTPISSAYVSTDTTPIYYRYFPVAITTVSGGAWVDENNIFDGNNNTYATLGGAADVVSQATYTHLAEFTGEGESTVYAYAAGGGTIEVIDENDAVLRTYQLPTSAGGTAIGIVRADNQIRFTTAAVNTSLLIGGLLIGGYFYADYVISGRVAFEFTDDTDLDKMVAPIIQTDENGDVKVPTTSTVDSTTVIPGVNKSAQIEFLANGSQYTFLGADDTGAYKVPLGARMVWAKADSAVPPLISDSESLFGKYLTTDSSNQASTPSAPELRPTESYYPPGPYFNVSGVDNYIAEIGVAPKVLDIVTWTGDGSSLREIPHNLGTKPGFIIVKAVNSGQAWVCWHKELQPRYSLKLNTQSSEYSSANFPSEPTVSAFYVNNNTEVNTTNVTYFAYVYAADSPGKVLCGSYIGNGATNYVTTGFQSGFVLIKSIDTSTDWVAVTEQSAAKDKYWHPNQTVVAMKGNGGDYVGLSGFTQISLNGGNTDYNVNGIEYVFLAISKDLTGPNSTQLNLLNGQDLEYFTDGTPISSNLAASGSNISFGSETYVGNSNAISINPTVGGQTFMDTQISSANKWLIWIKSINANYDHFLVDSERNPSTSLSSNLTNAELFDDVGYQEPNASIGYTVGSKATINSSGYTQISWNFQAAPQFFDVVKYVGNGASSHIIDHDLGVTPGFIITKRLDGAADWFTYHSSLPDNQLLYLNQNNSATINTNTITSTSASNFEVGLSGFANTPGGEYIAYVFAEDTPYVKCGSYTGDGYNGLFVDVGFKPRWVLIKSSNATGSWAILDKERPNQYIAANTHDGSQGLPFTFTSDGMVLYHSNAPVNVAGAEYIYVAIADEVEGHPPSPPSSSTVQGTPDVNAATMVVDAESFDVGDSASAPALEASITAVAGSEGSSLLVDSSTGTWLPGLYAKGTETTVTAPSADEITFTSTNQGTTPFSNVDATLTSRTWTLESGPSATGPWTVVDTYVDYDALNSQDGATPWSSNKPALAADTFYRVKVSYNSNNAESVESVFSTFKTSA